MSRFYFYDEGGHKRRLVSIQCDSCDAQIQPNKDISKSQWMCRGVQINDGDAVITEYCPHCFVKT